MTAPSFRFAVHTDAAALAELIERAYRNPDTAGRWDSESHLLTGPRTSREEMAALLADPDSRFLIAEIDGRASGCCLIQKLGSTGRPGGEEAPAYFGMFAIDARARNIGLGKQVLAEAEARVRKLWNAPAMVMTVINVRTELIAWYERRGYRLTGAAMPFPFSETSGEVTRDFHLVELRKDFA